MKSCRPMLSLSLLIAAAILAAFSNLALAQTQAQTQIPSDAQKTFDLMKTLAGNWVGSVTSDNPAWSTDQPMPLTIRVVSRGNALVHELSTPGPEVTMIYVENDRLTLRHYCDFANRPQMVAQASPNGKNIEFNLVDFTGSDAIGHVSHAVFTFIDPNHHVEDWIFLPAGGKPVHAHIDFKRVS
jgi:hypothetical protein